ncbi:DUF2894 domain-containing protein [Mycetohabitans sp. B2]|uniref:DUF2894 domain-containing protein n=1 Tax=Mycetohabitans sp. B2 TaxID=2841274 RepID=UPI001F268331|nr:DUF2894 domain-containing protein [Mycetohabitans sp. B2]
MNAVSHSETHARARLDAWRASGADRLDPVRFCFIDALERRTAGHVGAVRRRLERRLGELLNAYAADLERADPRVGNADAATTSREPADPTLAMVLDYIAARKRAHGDASAPAAASHPGSDPGPATLDYFRKTWAKVRIEKQLRQSLNQVPRNAGPLNSSSLVHRSLSLMRELSPGYLQQFLAYADTLSWMEQLNSGDPASAKDTVRAAVARKSARGKSR